MRLALQICRPAKTVFAATGPAAALASGAAARVIIVSAE
jgi:hypothetical protein